MRSVDRIGPLLSARPTGSSSSHSVHLGHPNLKIGPPGGPVFQRHEDFELTLTPVSSPGSLGVVR